ncbi:MAG: disulfide isomerase DsbC N-terminal domain-containing protein [Nitrospirota bacterium]|nr:disulfide isomerase DsbC N-terminal domain-containing protein [Nitrospirota bacterium]
MRKIIFLLTIILIFFTAANSFAFVTKGQDCSKCHNLKKDEASALLKELIPGVKILTIRTIPVRSMWEVVLQTNGRKELVYLDFSKKYLLSGSLIDIKGKKNLSQDRLADINKVNVSQIPLKDAPVMGDKNAKHKVIVFDDPE